MPYNIILFFFVYLIFMSLIVLYFLHSTSVVSFYIDVVLPLSISKHIAMSSLLIWFITLVVGLVKLAKKNM